MKKKILLSAFACRPSSGSEWGVGWNFFCELSNYFDVHLITEGEFKEEILLECRNLGIRSSNLHFVELSPQARKRCHNQGDWRFYVDYRLWQKRVLRYAILLNKRENFSLVHHLNMIGFREPGELWKMGLPFVLGPLGGFGNVPDPFFNNKFSVARFKNIIKIYLNRYSLYLPYVRRAIKHADVVIAAYPEAVRVIKEEFGKESVLIPETGCYLTADWQNTPLNERRNIAWIGKNVHRKQFDLAANAFLNSQLSSNEELIVIGEFSDSVKNTWRNFPNIKFLGQISKNDVMSELKKVRALLFTSVHEGNPHVVFESLSVGTPVICHDSFGMGHIVDDTIGVKIPQVSYSKSLTCFTNAIDDMKSKQFRNRDFTDKILPNSWAVRAEDIKNIYNRLTT